MKGEKMGKLYKLLREIVTSGVVVCTKVKPSCDNTELWHMWLGDLIKHGLNELHKRNLLHGVKACKLDFYRFYVMRKQKKVTFNILSHCSKGFLDYVHTDVWGPSSVALHRGSIYFVSFIDDYSRKAWVYFMKHKSEVFTIFNQWKSETKMHTRRKLKYIRSDNGTEYKDNTFLEYCKNEGITRHFTVKKTPQKVELPREWIEPC